MTKYKHVVETKVQICITYSTIINNWEIRDGKAKQVNKVTPIHQAGILYESKLNFIHIMLEIQRMKHMPASKGSGRVYSLKAELGHKCPYAIWATCNILLGFSTSGQM
jgi:hypothetical protein